MSRIMLIIHDKSVIITVDQVRSLGIEDHKSKGWTTQKKIKVEKVQSQEISKLRNFYVGKSLSPESCL